MSLQKLFTVLFFLVGIASSCLGQVRLANHSELVIDTAYEDLLARLEGEAPTRVMFASQDVTLTSFEPRGAADSANQSDVENYGAVRATIDIVGCSQEFGCMNYVMAINAREEQTTIDVQLVKPVGMLLEQSYNYAITPHGDHASHVKISHTLNVKLMRRRMMMVNRVIEKATRKKASEQICDLTQKMTQCVSAIGARPVSQSQNTQSPDGTPSPSVRHEALRPIGADDADALVLAPPANRRDLKLDVDSGLDLRVTITGATKIGGEMMIALYDSKQQYLAYDPRKPVKSQTTVFKWSAVAVTPKNQAKVVYVFKNVPAGEYAIGAYHDVDSNRMMNASMLGVPSESYGFSRDGRGTFGMPSYKKVMVQIDDQHREFTFQVK